jgi:hypothetical protein
MTAKEIVLDGLKLRAYKYEQDDENGGITIRARVAVDRTGREELERRLLSDDAAPGRYFEVRTDDQDTPHQMRFGGCWWSGDGDETKYDLALVEKSVDDNRTVPFPEFYREMPNVRVTLAFTRNLMAELLDTLVETGALSGERRSAIEDRAKAEIWTRHWALFKLDDIDNH